MTRAADRVSHGDVVGALEANPLGAVAALLFALAAVVTFLHLAFRLPIPEVKLGAKEQRWLRIGLGVAVFVNYGFVILRTRFPELL